MALALLFLAAYAVPIVKPDIPGTLRVVIDTVTAVIWMVFAADLVIRVMLAERRLHYLATHPIDVLAVVLPALRPLRVLRVFTAAQALVSRAGRFSVFKTTQAIAVTAMVLMFIGALAELDAERDAPNANITSFGDALWWAATTVTTVGYGDRYPTSNTGRLVAVALMLIGISLVGVVTASVAAWFISLTSAATAAEETAIEHRLQRLEEQLKLIGAAVLAPEPNRLDTERPTERPRGTAGP